MSERLIAGRVPIVSELPPGTYFWCACGRSQTQPFCDGSHAGTGLEPVEFTIAETKRCSLCTCKQTHNQPMCDGSHKSLPPFDPRSQGRDNSAMNIIFCTDLLFSTKITATAKAQSAAYVVVRTLEKLQQALDAAPANSTLIIDLNTAAVDVTAAITQARDHPSAVNIIGFVSHVDAELAAAARAAGAHRVMARSAFVNELESLLAPRQA